MVKQIIFAYNHIILSLFGVSINHVLLCSFTKSYLPCQRSMSHTASAAHPTAGLGRGTILFNGMHNSWIAGQTISFAFAFLIHVAQILQHRPCVQRYMFELCRCLIFVSLYKQLFFPLTSE